MVYDVLFLPDDGRIVAKLWRHTELSTFSDNILPRYVVILIIWD